MDQSSCTKRKKTTKDIVRVNYCFKLENMYNKWKNSTSTFEKRCQRK